MSDERVVENIFNDIISTEIKFEIGNFNEVKISNLDSVISNIIKELEFHGFEIVNTKDSDQYDD